MSAPTYVILPFQGEHRRAVSALSFAPSSSREDEATLPVLLASASADASVKVWEITEAMISEASSSSNITTSSNIQNVQPRVTLVGHTRGINDVCWSRNTSRYIATASDDKTLRLWDSSTGEALVEFRGHANFVFSCKFNPQSNLLVSGSFDETVKLWDVRSGECVSTLPAHSEPVTSVDFNADGTCVASASHDGLIRIWDTFSGECIKTLYAQGNPPVTSLIFSPNGRYILAGTLDSKLRLWDTTTKYHPRFEFSLDDIEQAQQQSSKKRPAGLKCAKTYSGHVNTKFCTFAAFCVANPNRQLIACGSEDGNVYLYGLQSRKIEQVLSGHAVTNTPTTNAGPTLAVAAHSTREILATGGMSLDRTVRVWVPQLASSEVVDEDDETIPSSTTNPPC